MSAVNGNRQAGLFAAEAEGPFAGVVLNRPVDQVFTYRVPARLAGRLAIGSRVRVPLGRGNNPAVGYCVRLDAAPPDDGFDPERVKDLLDVLDEPPLIDDRMLDLTRWMGGYYACSWGQALDAVVPAGVKKGAGTQIRTCLVVPPEVLHRGIPSDLPSKQAEALALLFRSTEPLTVSDVCRLTKCTTAPISSLRKRGLVRAVKRRMDRPIAPEEAAPEPSRDAARPDRRAARGARRPDARPGWRRLRRVPVTRRHRQRQDRGVPQRHRARGGPGTRGDRAGPRDQPDAADDPPVPPALSEGRRPAQPPQRRRAAPALEGDRRGRDPGGRRRAFGGLRPDAAARADRDRRGARINVQAGDRPALPRARCRREAGAARRRVRDPRLGHPGAGNLAKLRGRALHPADPLEARGRPPDAARSRSSTSGTRSPRRAIPSAASPAPCGAR